LLYEAAQQKIKPKYTQYLLQALHRQPPEQVQTGKTSRIADPISDREQKVLELLAEGLSNKEIADRLCIEVRTVKWHTGNIFGKLNVKNRTEAVTRARDLNILP